jgi:hypothetical protein
MTITTPLSLRPGAAFSVCLTLLGNTAPIYATVSLRDPLTYVTIVANGSIIEQGKQNCAISRTYILYLL